MSNSFPVFINDEESVASANVVGSIDITLAPKYKDMIDKIKEGRYIILPELNKNLKTNEFQLVGFHITVRKDNEL